MLRWDSLIGRARKILSPILLLIFPTVGLADQKIKQLDHDMSRRYTINVIHHGEIVNLKEARNSKLRKHRYMNQYQLTVVRNVYGFVEKVEVGHIPLERPYWYYHFYNETQGCGPFDYECGFQTSLEDHLEVLYQQYMRSFGRQWHVLKASEHGEGILNGAIVDFINKWNVDVDEGDLSSLDVRRQRKDLPFEKTFDINADYLNFEELK